MNKSLLWPSGAQAARIVRETALGRCCAETETIDAPKVPALLICRHRICLR
jgi:hypothetical protein